MDITVPDTLAGAVLLSVIDFFLSFVVISFIGVVLAAFPLLNRARQGTLEQAEPSVQAAMSETVDMTTEDHAAAISAAVYATIGSHRIVRIEEAQHGLGWVLAGRAAHHAGRPVPHSLRS
jgi:hypothetical protein